MIRFPTRLDDVAAEDAIVRAGGTDLTERRRLGLAPGDLVDLRDVAGLDTITETAAGLKIGAMARLHTVATHPRVTGGYPAFAAAAGGLATPQIRAVATLGGSLLQRSRCWYYRNPEIQCLKKGGSSCFAKKGDHLYHACFDLGPCVAVHPSTLAMALLAYDAQVSVRAAPDRSVADLLGDGSDPRREHTLKRGAVLTAVQLPARQAGERAAYFRAISRAFSEWPLVECAVRLVVEGGRVKMARVAVGGVAPVPLRLSQVEAALEGGAADSDAYAAAAELAREGTSPLPMTGYKVDLLVGTVLETLERAHHGTPVAASTASPP
jgi:xanthine dehydrogenase YagS FAD-binding subunit